MFYNGLDIDVPSLCQDNLTLHKFYSFSEQTIEALAGPYLWFSHISEFNDPFEAQFQYNYRPNLEEALFTSYVGYWGNYPDHQPSPEELALRAEHERDPDVFFEKQRARYQKEFEDFALKDRFAYSCLFSERNGKAITEDALILMWSHYGRALKGFKVNYDAKSLLESLGDIRAFFMEYVEKPRSVDLNFMVVHMNQGRGPRLQADTFYEDARTKHKAWEYEAEFRIGAYNAGPIEYSPQAITSVEFGEHMPERQRAAIYRILNSQNPNIKFLVSRRRVHSYRIEVVPYER